MKLISAIAAVLVSALMTVPTVTQAAGNPAAEVRLALAAVQAEATDAVA